MIIHTVIVHMYELPPFIAGILFHCRGLKLVKLKVWKMNVILDLNLNGIMQVLSDLLFN